MHTAFEKVSNCLIICHIASFVADIKKVFRLFGFVNVRIWSTAATFTAEDLAASLAIITPVTLAKREKPIVGRNPIQFLKPVSPDGTRTRLGVVKADIPPKASQDLFVSAGQDVLNAVSTSSVISSAIV